VAIPRGIAHALAFARRIVAGEAQVPELAGKVVGALAAQALAVQDQVHGIERELMTWYRASALARRIATVPGVGLLGATALAATVTDPGQFRSGCQFAAWLGLTPRLNSSGGKERLGRISKMGDRYLRRLLIVGMTSLVRQAKRGPGTTDPRLALLLARKPARVATVAMANKAARVIWAIMTRGGVYRAPQAA
jgi:transposase